MKKKLKTESVTWTPAPVQLWDPAWGKRSNYRIVGFLADGERWVEYETCHSPQDNRAFAEWLTGRVAYNPEGVGGLVTRVEIEVFHPSKWETAP